MLGSICSVCTSLNANLGLSAIVCDVASVIMMMTLVIDFVD